MSAERDKVLEVDTEGNVSVDFQGLKIRVGSDEECEAATCVVCCEPSPALTAMFPDNIQTTCAGCQCAIVHRPHVPKAPPKLCVGCAMKLTVNNDKALITTVPRG